MQKTWKRFWALLLCLTMLSTMVFAVHAEETDELPEEQIEVVEQLASNETSAEPEEQAEEADEFSSEVESIEEEQLVDENDAELKAEEQPDELAVQEEAASEIAPLVLSEEQSECEHVFYYSKVNNNTEHVGKCSICGFTTEPQAHSCIFDEEMIQRYNPGQTIFETSHIAFCTECLSCVSLPHTPDENGVCTGCGYEVKETSDVECVHLWQVSWSTSGKGHTLKCLRCDLKIEEDCTWVHPEGEPGWGNGWKGIAGHRETCTVCGYTRRADHDYDAARICTVCGYEEHEHAYVYTPENSTTVFGEGYVYDDVVIKRGRAHNGYCVICKEKGFEDEGTYGAHNWENGVCAQCGYVQHEHDDHYDPNPSVGYNMKLGHIKTCSICNESVRAAHTWENEVCTVCGFDKNHTCDFSVPRSISAWVHSFVCAECGSYDSNYHSMDGNGMCDVCGYVDPVFHTHSVTEIPGYEATCTETGLTTIYSCTCGKLFKDAACTIETEAAEVIPTKEHDWKDATCTAPMTCTVCGTTAGTIAAHTPGQWANNEDSHWRLCTVCGTKFDENAHSDDGKGVCGVCGFEMPKEEHVHAYKWDGKNKDKNGHTMTCSCGDSHKDAHTRNALGRCSVCGYSITTAAKVTETVRTVVTTVVNRILSILFRPRG